MQLDEAQSALLLRLARGHSLKSRRFLDGRKEFQLLDPAGTVTTIQPETVIALHSAGLLATNMKFPAAQFFLSEAGRAVVAPLLAAAPDEPDS